MTVGGGVMLTVGLFVCIQRGDWGILNWTEIFEKQK